MNNLYKKQLANHLADFLKVDAEEVFSLISSVPKDKQGDFSLPCFFLATKLKQSPAMVAEEISKNMELPKDFSDLVAVNGYLNFTINQKNFTLKILSSILEERKNYGKGFEGKKQKVILDFSSPNMGKELAFHHLRGTMLGHSLSCLFQASGYETLRINHLGDWGTSYGKLIVAYLNQVKENASFKDQNLTIEELNLLYTQFSQNAKKDTSLEDQARLVFKELEEGKDEYQNLWKMFREITLKELQKMYSILGVYFDSYKGEAFFVDKVDGVVNQLQKNNLMTQSEGASIVDLEQFDMIPLLLQKSDGSTLYATRDICAAIFRKEKYDFDLNLYVVDNGQSLHFNQFFKVLELMGYEWAKQCQHIPFGLVLNQSSDGKWEKGKTRTGQSSLLKDVLKQASQKILKIINHKNPDLENKEKIAQKIAVVALAFNDLKHKRQNNVKFDWHQTLSFEGDSGPYVVNAFVRLKSVLRKYELENSKIDAVSLLELLKKIQNLELIYKEEQAQDLVTLLAQLSEKRSKACESQEPYILTQYTLVLSDAIHRFVHHCRVLGSEEQEERILLVYCAQRVLKNALNWIGLDPVEYM